MLKIGLTGGIGSGKSTACHILQELGIPVFDADSQAKHLMNTDPELKESITILIGRQAYTATGLNRALIANTVFNNPEKLRQLNSLVHPKVREAFTGWVSKQQRVPYVIQEAAILFESGAYKYMDLTIAIYADIALRIQRVASRDGIPPELVKNRMDNQWPAEKINALADYTINNDNNALLLPQILRIDSLIRKKL